MDAKVNLQKARKFVLQVFILAFVFASGYFVGVKGFRARVDNALKVSVDRQIPPDKNVDFGLFWKVWDTLSASYYDKTKLIPSEMVYGAIRGMTSSLGDPYTVYLTPKENKVVDEDLSGKLEGVGIQIGFKEKTIAVISPLPDSPAKAAGIRAGDFVINIRDVQKNIDISTNGMSLNEAVQAIRGPAGSKVTLTLVREGSSKPIEIELTRARLNIPSVVLEYPAGTNIAHIKLIKFDADTLSEWNQAVNDILQRSDILGIVLDVRNNPGGYLQSAVDIAGDFVDSGTTIVVEQKGNGEKVEYDTDRLARLKKYKLIVLINEGSASASEILAGALRDQKGVLLVGEQSFGKGTVQEPIQIPGGSGLHVTVAKWLTPKGTWVHEKGLEPDAKILDDEEKEGDEQLDAAIKEFDR